MSWSTLAFLSAVLATASSSTALAPGPQPAAAALAADASAPVRLGWSRATGALRLAAVEPGALPLAGATAAERAEDFLSRYGAAFGVADPGSELERADELHDRLGHTHLTYRQVHHGLPVFAAAIRAHFDAEGRLTAVNGGLAPAVSLADLSPTLGADAAAARALLVAAKDRGRTAAPPLEVVGSALMVFRSGLVRGVPGRDHLAHVVEVTDHAAFAAAIVVDAHDGTVLDRIPRAHDILRRVHRSRYPNPVWREGDPLPYQGGDPTTTLEVNRLVDTAGQTHALFRNLSGGTYRSFDGADAAMNSVQGSVEIDCPNATWNGSVVSVCEGMASDDVIAHEWTHAYTQYTHGLVYQWQPGALNEAYSDIFGETVDLLNGTGSDSPGPARSQAACSAYGGSSPPELVVGSPASVAGTYAAGDAVFNPLPPWSVTAPVELVADAAAPSGDGCGPLLGFPAGRIALVHRGTCTFRVKVANALDAGAVGVIVVNNQGDEVITMGGDGPRFPIPAVLVGRSTGAALEAALPDGLTATLAAEGATDPSLRWLIGEDTSGAPLRDMWRPPCLGDPARVGDPYYACGTDDHGGVHTNSGVPNHAFALLVDGGTFNGVEVGAVGLTRAAHLHWRAMRYYQVPTTDFADHAGALDQACRDLVGEPLTDLRTGATASEVITAAHCHQVTAAMAAVEMGLEPSRCSFGTLLEPDPPRVRGRTLLVDDFETDPAGRWDFSNFGVFAEYRPRDWAWTEDLAGGRSGRAMFAPSSLVIGDCRPGSDDQSGVMRMDSPEVTLPSDGGAPVLLFDHYVATESRYDGGNLKVSVNHGPFELVPTWRFRFNPYNDTLESAAGGNTCPLAGQPAFTGSDEGSVGGTWGQSQVDLGGLAGPGDTLRLRFELGVDGCNGLDGWYVDDVRLVLESAARRVGGRVGVPAP